MHDFAPPPRFITRLDPNAPSEGRAIARVARAMGKPMMPWQRLVVQGATEMTPEGFYKYHTVVITVPRQSGKTTLVGPVQTYRIMKRKNSTAFFTAQTGKDAHKRMLDLIKLTTSSPLGHLFHPRYAASGAGLELATGSLLQHFAPGPDALHGETPHLVTRDEFWTMDSVEGAQFMGAVGPAQATLEGESQLWLISTMGTAESTFMNSLVERGRKGEAGIFYAEWSMADGMDPYDPATWWTFHPALGNTINESYLRKEMHNPDLSPGEFIRAYMNRLTTAANPLVKPEQLAALNKWGDVAVPSRRDIVVTYDVGDDREDSAVWASWRTPEGIACSRLLHTAPGTVWLVPFIRKIAKTWKPAVIGADKGGETRAITDELRRAVYEADGTTLKEAALEVLEVEGGDIATASVTWLDMVRSGDIRLDNSTAIQHAMARAVLARMGESWKFSRKNSTGSIASVIASIVGVWLYDHRDAPLPKAQIL